MKKIIAMILALTTAAGMAVSAMAATPSDNNIPPVLDSNAYDITFEKSTDGLVLGTDTVLTSGKTFYFPIRYKGQNLTSSQYNSFKFHFGNEEGKRSIESMKVEKHKSVYSLAITTKKAWPVTLTEVSYNVTVVDTKNTSADIKVPGLSFQVGYQSIDENSLKNPDYVIVNPSRPVITEDNFQTLNEMADGKEVTFANDDWEFAVKVKGMKDANLLSNQDDIDEILEKYENQDFKFISFPAGPEFRSTGTLSIDVSSEMEDYEGKFFVYRYLNGKLTKMDASVNVEEEVLTLKTKQLGRFVITNKAIKDSVVVDNNNSSSNSSSSNSSNGTGGTTGTTNPGTGANDFVGLAAAMAVVAAAGLVVARKK